MPQNVRIDHPITSIKKESKWSEIFFVKNVLVRVELVAIGDPLGKLLGLDGLGEALGWEATGEALG